MIYKLLVAFTILILLFLNVYPQINTRNFNEQKVKRMLVDFHRTIFYEMNPAKSIKNHFYHKGADTIDKEFGLESDYFELGKKLDNKLKFKQVLIEIYGEGAIGLIQIKLGIEKIKEDSKFIDGEMASDENIEKLWQQTLADMGLTEADLDKMEKFGDPSEKRIESEYKFMQNLNRALRKRLDLKLIKKNLVFINENTKVKKEVFKGREYFEVSNKLFHLKIAIKNGTPKIMYINRNFEDSNKSKTQ